MEKGYVNMSVTEDCHYRAILVMQEVLQPPQLFCILALLAGLEGLFQGRHRHPVLLLSLYERREKNIHHLCLLGSGALLPHNGAFALVQRCDDLSLTFPRMILGACVYV